MGALAAGVVWAIHVAIVAFVVWAPFSNSEAALALHVLVVPFLWLHWLLNDDTCALTLLEARLRGVPPQKSFVHSVVSPVYRIRDEHARMLAWGGSVGLWLAAVARVRRRPGLLRRALLGA